MNPGSSATARLKSESYIDCYLLDYDNMVRFASGSSLFSYISYGRGSLSVTFKPNKSDSYYFAFGHQSSKGYYSVQATYDLHFDYLVYDTTYQRYECSSYDCEFEDVEPTEIIVAENPYSSELKCVMTLPDSVGIIALVVTIVLGIIIVLVVISCICPSIFTIVLGVFVICFTCNRMKKEKSSAVSEDSSLLRPKPEQPTTSAGTSTDGSFEQPKTEYGVTPTPSASSVVDPCEAPPPAYVAEQKRNLFSY